MSDQRHVIQRQILELEIAGGDQAQQLQAEMSRVYRQRIIPLIDQYCSELSSPDEIHRIDSLEIDIGKIDPKNFEADFVSKARTALRQALTGSC